MKKFLLIFIFLFQSFVYSQKETNNWYFGVKAGLDFNNGVPVALSNGKMQTFEGCATISDKNGNLLFYTDGSSVWNKNHDYMPNGFALFGDYDSTNSAIIIPKVGNPNIYYVFTVSSSNRGLNYSEVDMTLNNGLGDVTSNKNILLDANPTEKLTAVRKKNASGYWVVAHRAVSDEFISFDVSNSVNLNPIVSKVGSVHIVKRGAMKISPDGTKLLSAKEVSGGVELFSFDASTGIVSNPVVLNEIASSYGVEFSPDSRFAYSQAKPNIEQYDTNLPTAVEIINSKEIISNVIVGSSAAMQLAPDKKIYVANYFSPYIHVINNPNEKGIDSNFEASKVFVGGRCELGLPSFIQSFFTVGIIVENLCLGDITKFTLTSNETIDSVLWDFGDGNMSNSLAPSHNYINSGTFLVKATITSGSETKIETTEVVIFDVPTATKPNNLSICDEDNDGFYSFNLKDLDTIILNGQNPDNYSLDYYVNSIDYDNNIPITDYTNYINANAFQQQTIIASVKNKSNTNCETTTSFTIQVFESPKPALNINIPNLTSCDNTTFGTEADGKIIFDLTERANIILNGQSETAFLISYYEDENLTQLISNPNNFSNKTSQQTIYVKVENKQNSTCFAKTSFLLEVFELPIINKTVSITQCDNNDINGFSFFNLNEVKEKIITNPANYTITFHEEKTQAENNQNAIVNITSYENQIVSADTIWARVENSNGCYEVSEVNLFVSTTQIPSTLLKSYFQCDDGISSTDGIATFNFSDITNEILNIFPVNQQLDINYYRNEADALSEENAISDISNYQNIGYPNQQTIYVRVDSKVDNSCLGLGAHISLHVEKVPIANPVSINPECDNDRDGFFAFDTSTIQNTIIGPQTNVSVRYFDENGIELSSPLPNPFITKSQKITARIENTTSNDLDGKCFDETILDFIVNTVPIANPIAPQTACDDDFDGIVAFDTSQIQSTIIGDQTGLIIKYFDENNNPLPSPLPNPFVTASQSIRVRIENPIYDVCYEEAIIDFTVYEKPFVDIISEDIICITNNAQLELKVENPTPNYTYTWKDENETIIDYSASVNVSKGGIYKVFATSTFGCNSDEQEILIRESSISSININDIEVQDDSENNFIKINTQNLGLGDYEFRLLDQNFKVLFDYQNEPIFDNLDGGVYNLEINDKNACGAVPFEIALISFPKFFTPNGDGVNDFWQIKGIDKSYYKSGVITIFNRFGKTISSFTINDNGWDGTYNGSQMIANDYWFRVVLIKQNDEVKNRSGYFSLLRN